MPTYELAPRRGGSDLFLRVQTRPQDMRHGIPLSNAPLPRDFAKLFEQLERSCLWLDAEYRIPFTRIHVGWDPIMGLVPIAGDLAGAALSIRNIHWAYQLGAERRVLRQMGLNAAIDALIGAIPVIGTVFDFWFRAQLRNLQLLIEAMERQRQHQSSDGVPLA